MNRRPEAKVVAAAGGASVVSGLILGVLGVTVFGVPFDADHSDAAIKAVPGFLSLAISGMVTFLLGYWAPRTTDRERDHDVRTTAGAGVGATASAQQRSVDVRDGIVPTLGDVA